MYMLSLDRYQSLILTLTPQLVQYRLTSFKCLKTKFKNLQLFSTLIKFLAAVVGIHSF